MNPSNKYICIIFTAQINQNRALFCFVFRKKNRYSQIHTYKHAYDLYSRTNHTETYLKNKTPKVQFENRRAIVNMIYEINQHTSLTFIEILLKCLSTFFKSFAFLVQENNKILL